MQTSMPPTAVPAYDLAPLVTLALIGAVLALGPVAWVWLRQRGRGAAARRRALTVLTLFLTFDLVLFGAFTRLTDSGLGCPDWPGCYGSGSPLGAHAQISAAQLALPQGPVTHGKAWVEMVHRYLATGVGALIVVLAVWAWVDARRRRRDAHAADADAVSPWWATGTLAWVCVQGAFGALTVTMKLYPLIVTLHLLGGMMLLALLAVQAAQATSLRTPLSPALHAAAIAIAGLSVLQIALGGWVSTNYAVLACGGFPSCQGSYWPEMDFEHGFALLRELGEGRDGAALPFAALTAIHYVHRLVAYALLGAMLVFGWRLHARGLTRPWAIATLGIAAWQFASGLSNVVLGWPLIGAVAHTAGAAAWVVLLTLLLSSARPARQAAFRKMHAFP